jgi:hypothetical protein
MKRLRRSEDAFDEGRGGSGDGAFVWRLRSFCKGVFIRGFVYVKEDQALSLVGPSHLAYRVLGFKLK